MAKKEEIPDYDEEQVIKFTLGLVPEEFKTRIGEDEIQYVLDVMYDYYDEKGYINEDTAEEASIDEDEMLKYLLTAAKKDKIDLAEDEIQFILDCEYDYGLSSGIYSEEE